MNMNFYMPTRVFTGVGCVAAQAAQIAALGQRAFLVTGPTAAQRSGALADLTEVLQQQGIPWTLHNSILPNPSLESCFAAARQARESGAEFVAGIGGGSALDAAKVVAVLAANPDLDQTALYQMHWKNPPLPVLCIGTTAGTGSEVTSVAVLTLPDGMKKSIHCDDLFPTLSLGDPRYTASMSEDFTRSTAIDALAHCVESYFSRKANEISMAWSAQGVRVLLPELERLASGAKLDLEHRAALYHASIYGGLAISVTGTAFPHTMGYPLTEQYHVPHGTACAVFLPAFLRHNAEAAPERTAAFFQQTGCTEQQLQSILQRTLPPCQIQMTRQEIDALAPRWENNKSLKNTLGTVTPAFVSQLYESLFAAS